MMILLFIPSIVSMGVAPGFVSSAVIMMHIYSEANFTLTLLYNELGLMAVGFGVALLVNMYMGDIQKQLDHYRIQVEELYRKIFSEIVKYLESGDTILGWKRINRS